MRAWTEIGFSSIYYLLKKLEQKELIQGWLENNELGPARKVYHITKVGQSVLREEVLEDAFGAETMLSAHPDRSVRDCRLWTVRRP